MTIQHQGDALTVARAQVTAEMREFFDLLLHGADTGGLEASDLALIAGRAPEARPLTGGSTPAPAAAAVNSATSIAEQAAKIAKQSQDQAASIGEVNAAVRQMDEMTQRNAALVEETNASIEQTEKQAIELDEIVAVFATGGAVPPRAQAARQSPSAQPKPPQGIKALQEKVKTAARSYLNHGNAAVDKDWEEF